ncbi:pirin family protein [Thalassotalea sediminis]|uniref:pirin family protein n=1 Tax=Thalassotalea sediminis TaxID=1759089 RepID=UPI002572C951|nr:pirin-like C-terminal cupin domain-containing protein [Thalassotalea sediminis]
MTSPLKQATLYNEHDMNKVIFSAITHGQPFQIRGGFDALGFRHTSFGDLMDPLIMVDHYTMTKPTFGAHPHAGLSAVSLLFEDSIGKFHNRDSLGNDFDLLPGDLYWLNAGNGVVHDESPRENARIHGLQVFVNLPKALKMSAPQSSLVRSEQMPVITGPGYRVRLAVGESNGIKGALIPSNYLTILDGKLLGDSTFSHQTKENEQSWIYAVAGNIDIVIGEKVVSLKQGQSIAAKTMTQAISIMTKASEDAHFVLFSGPAIKETFIQRGPFVMSTEQELDNVQRDYELGKLGTLRY